MATATKGKRTPSPTAIANRKKKEREAKRANRAWFVKLFLWTLRRPAPWVFLTALVLRDDFRLWFWVLFCTIVPMEMIPGMAAFIPFPTETP